ncbi:uncharacterized protein EV154DRAFT_556343 [Mucor mucedo]|uniref:uncharacterized protein n=1 Tax=Mucor mucedo TaxID=29922 RepID=UPI0022200D40|nr:uncharacterized protein EV154DRAFT_556343 [Mucor mucedo]KAI7873225.1 hypothetical protein EV154DRAFT_556343 [Mucor mucedo]
MKVQVKFQKKPLQKKPLQKKPLQKKNLQMKNAVSYHVDLFCSQPFYALQIHFFKNKCYMFILINIEPNRYKELLDVFCRVLNFDKLRFQVLYTKKRLLRRKQENGAEAIETETPTTKTAHVNTYRLYPTHFQSPECPFKFPWIWPNKWKPLPYKEDKSKVPLVVFGTGMFGKDLVKLKRLECGVTGVMWRSLKKREAACELIAITIDEYKTSKVCSQCYFDTLKVWQSDVNAAGNMMIISKAIWSGEGRPEAFEPKKTKQ